MTKRKVPFFSPAKLKITFHSFYRFVVFLSAGKIIQVHVNQTVSDEKKENPIGRYAAE